MDSTATDLAAPRALPLPDQLLRLLLSAFLAAEVLLFWPDLYDSFTLPKQALFVVAGGATLAVLLWSGRDPLPRDRLLRAAILALAASVTLSTLLADDRLSSILGVYQYRQGYVTHLAGLVVFVGGARVARDGGLPSLLRGGLAGLLGASLYAAVQKTGHDPVTWWIDTSERAFGTTGNANDLAGYVVLAVAFGSAAYALSAPWRWAALVAFGTVLSFTLIASESRSGLAAALVSAAVFLAAARFVGVPGPAARRTVAALAGGLVVGVALGVLVGAAQETGARVLASADEADGADDAIVTRVAYVRGTLPVVADAAALGHGPDGLVLGFPRSRPADLGGLFREEDLAVQSSHNWFLDQAANAGLVGLALLLTLLGVVFWRTARRERGRGDVAAPFLWSGLAGYVAFVMVNPPSVGVHAIFLVLLGALVGRCEAPLAAVQKRPARSWLRASRFVGVAVAGASVALAVAVVAADVYAERAWADFVWGRFDAAASDFRRAQRLVPFERTYLRGEAQARLVAGACWADASQMEEARQRLWLLAGRFEPAAEDVLDLAVATAALDGPGYQLDALLRDARARNPHGVELRRRVERLEDAARGGRFAVVYHVQADERGVLVVRPEEAALLSAGGCRSSGAISSSVR